MKMIWNEITLKPFSQSSLNRSHLRMLMYRNIQFLVDLFDRSIRYVPVTGGRDKHRW
jgi:hypothetical protein